MAPPITAREIGPVYDLLLQTRDGQSLPCRNNDGRVVQVSQVAYMTTIDPSRNQHEETELQHKDALVQLGSANLIDREFDQWPQVTQGDWSGGALQRVFSGPNADASRYWDGLGVLWPMNDYLPQKVLVPPAVIDTSNNVDNLAGIGPISGALVNGGLSTFSFLEHDATLGKWFLVTYVGTQRLTCDLSTPIAGFAGAVDLLNFCEHFFVMPSSPANIWYGDATGNVTKLADLPAGGACVYQASTAGSVGGRVYLAAAMTTATANFIRLYDITPAGGSSTFTGTSFVDLNFSSAQVFNIFMTEFEGSDLVISVNDGSTSWLVRYSIPSGTFTTVTSFPGYPECYVVNVQGALFVAAINRISATFVELFLIQGSTVQDIGPLQVQIGVGASSYIRDILKPAAMGPYAILPVVTSDQSGTTYVVHTFYDVLRGRFFKGCLIPYPNSVFTIGGQRIAVFPSASRPVEGSGVKRFSNWSIIYNTNTPAGASIPTVQEAMIGVANVFGYGTPNINSFSLGFPVQQGSQFTSSIVDFTSSQPKLFREVAATFSPLPADLRATVMLEVWLDRDPAALPSQADFSISIDGGTMAGAERLALPVNTIATKLVYRVTTTGGDFAGVGNLLVAAAKLVSVIVRAATGWVQTLMLDLAPQLQSNSKNVLDIWTQQGIDSTTAYNFLRQLWRLRGGACNATFPNGDSGPWLLQDAAFDSPKPFGVSFRADQRSGLKYIATLKLREDIA